jgi:uncharacterized protein DUF4352
MRMKTISAAVILAALGLAGCETGGGLRGVAASAAPEAHYTGPTSLADPDTTEITEEATPTESTDAPESAPDLGIHDPLAVTDGEESVDANIRINSVRYTSAPGNSYGDRSKNGYYVIVSLTVQVTKGTLPVNPLYFGYQTADGTVYHTMDGNAIFAGFEPGLDAGDVSAGRRVRGNVVFDVPRGRGASLTYEGPLGDVIGSWHLS